MPRKAREIPWLLAREGGTFYVHWYDATERREKRLSLRTTDPATAQARYAAFLVQGAEIFDGASAPAQPSGGRHGSGLPELTVEQALDIYHDKHVVTATVPNPSIPSVFKQLKGYMGDRRVSEVDNDLCKAYIAARQIGPVGKLANSKRIPAKLTTIRRELTILSTAISFCLRKKYSDPVKAPDIFMPEKQPGRVVWLFADELRALIKAGYDDPNDPWIGPFIEVAYYTAARRRSVERLRWSQVYDQRKRINLLPEGDSETSKRRPIVPIDPDLEPALAKLRDMRAGDWLFGSDRNMSYAFEQAAKRAGLATVPKSDMRLAGAVTPHILRHTRATHLLEADVEPWAVASLLGDSVTTVLRVYAHACPDHVMRALVKSKSRNRAAA